MAPRRHRLSRKERRELWEAEAAKAVEAELGEFPICNICDLPVHALQDWDQSHMPVAHSFGGVEFGIGHRRCNRLHGAQVVRPALAKSDRIRERHVNIRGEGLGRTPMDGGRRSPVSKTIEGRVVPRLHLRDKLIAAGIIKIEECTDEEVVVHYGL